VNLAEYISRIERNLRAGNATEHTHRAALAALIDGLEPGQIHATNEPRRSAFGAIDYVVSRASSGLPIGHIEAKDVGLDLGSVEKGEQLTRYRRALSNLILTDYLEFRWYLDGGLRATARLGTPDRNGAIKRDKAGGQAVLDLLRGFVAQSPPTVGNPRELAERMAELTHALRDQVLVVLSAEGEQGNLHAQLRAFRQTLVPDLDAESFADMYAQTVAYGLFAARAATPIAPNFSRMSAPFLLPRTNPFLRRFFNEIAGPDLDERVSWLVDALAALIGAADIAQVLREFGRRTRREDPVVHFYETFLAKYDPRLRESRGVYYTPEPVVSYMVRSVDRLIKSQLGRSGGLADPSTVILDPALGTGTFLYGVIDEIYQNFLSFGNAGAWPSYVAEKLLGRIYGFELLMAPYAVAHLKLGLLLQQTGYEPRTQDERLGIYLTNTLAEGVDSPPIPFAGYISDEANAATGVKRDTPIEVVIGNPPYSGHSANKGEWIGGLVRDYYQVDGRPLGERNPKWLQDDYVKFIRFGQWRIDRTGQGILAFISNNGYLDNPTFRGMRQSLMGTFSRIYILDLHGNSRKRERTPDGGPDENVFDIMQGVAIALFVKEPGSTGPATVYHADLWGARECKYRELNEADVDTTEWTELAPTSPSYLFTPQDADLRAEYQHGSPMPTIMGINSVGVVTSRDSFVLDFEESKLRQRISDFADLTYSDEYVRDRYLGRSDKLPVAAARSAIRDGKENQSFTQCVYRPFDARAFFYHDAVIERSRREVMRHMVKDHNLALTIGRAGQVIGPGEWNIVFCTERPSDFNLFRRGGTNLFPLYLYPEPGHATYHRSDAIGAARKAIRAREGELGAAETMRQLNAVADLVRTLYPEEEYPRWPNLAPAFIADIAARLGLGWVPDGASDLCATFGPEDVFHYTYAVLHSPTYRSRYAPFLKSDFPRVPLTADLALFRDLAALGAQLVDLHLLRAPELAQPPHGYPQAGTDVVDRVTYDEQERRVFINKTQHFTHVPPEVWNFHVGGYQVAEKWLKDRKTRKLTYDDQQHYKKTLAALARTIALMAAIDERIPGWSLA